MIPAGANASQALGIGGNSVHAAHTRIASGQDTYATDHALMALVRSHRSGQLMPELG
jgi:hypothetical protein